MRLKRTCMFGLVLLLFETGAAAQPGGVVSRFSALETCNDAYLERAYVFVGRVVSLEEAANPFGGFEGAWRAVVAVETSLKGRTGGRVKLLLSNFPHASRSDVKGRRFIFTASRVTLRGFGGLYSDRWSKPL